MGEGGSALSSWLVTVTEPRVWLEDEVVTCISQSIRKCVSFPPPQAYDFLAAACYYYMQLVMVSLVVKFHFKTVYAT